MPIPRIHGVIRRRVLLNFRADPAVVQRMLPGQFRPKLHRGFALVGVCLIRLEEVRLPGLPTAFGMSSENAAHRFAVEWDEAGQAVEGVYIPRRDTDSMLNRLVGGRLFPGEQHAAKFEVEDDGSRIEFHMRSSDGLVEVSFSGTAATEMPQGSIFASVMEASQFFEKGEIGYSATDASDRLDGLRLKTENWTVAPLSISAWKSSFFEDLEQFPKGSIEFDHALVMRNLAHEWHAVPTLAAATA